MINFEKEYKIGIKYIRVTILLILNVWTSALRETFASENSCSSVWAKKIAINLIEDCYLTSEKLKIDVQNNRKRENRMECRKPHIQNHQFNNTTIQKLITQPTRPNYAPTITRLEWKTAGVQTYTQKPWEKPPQSTAAPPPLWR